MPGPRSLGAETVAQLHRTATGEIIIPIKMSEIATDGPENVTEATEAEIAPETEPARGLGIGKGHESEVAERRGVIDEIAGNEIVSVVGTKVEMLVEIRKTRGARRKAGVAAVV